MGNHDEARAFFDKSTRWMQQNAPDDEELREYLTEAQDLLDSLVGAATRAGGSTSTAGR